MSIRSCSRIDRVCLNGYLPHQPGMQQHPLYVIRTQSEYEALQSALRDSASICADTTLPVIDFTRSTLPVVAQGQKQLWPAPTRRWMARYRQIVETVFEKVHNSFGLENERPHQLDGFQMRLSAKIALHNICIWINRSLGRRDLATADLLGWT